MKKINNTNGVSGGSPTNVGYQYFLAHQGEHIGKYNMSNYVGEKFVMDNDNDYMQFNEGILTKSCEGKIGCRNIRLHYFTDTTNGESFYVNGDTHECYLYKE